MRRLLLCLSVIAVFGAFMTPAVADAQQSVDLFIGGFTPRPLDARDNNDVLVQDGFFLSTFNRSSGIDIGQFNHVTVGGDWLFPLGHFFDGGLGLAYYQRTVPTVDTFNVNGTTGNNIVADLKLRIVPFSATVRLLPLGHQGFQPYIGAGVNIYYWRYSETGQFVDYGGGPFGPCPNCAIIQGNFVGSGGAVGPVVLGGVRVPIGSVRVGGEIRWQGGSGDLPASQGFAGPKIELGGFNYLATFQIHF